MGHRHSKPAEGGGGYGSTTKRKSFHAMHLETTTANKVQDLGNIADWIGEIGDQNLASRSPAPVPDSVEWSHNIVAELCVDCPVMHPFSNDADFKKTWTEDCTVVSIVCRGVNAEDLDKNQNRKDDSLSCPRCAAIKAGITKALGVLNGLTQSGKLGKNCRLIGLTGDLGKWTFAEDMIRDLAGLLLFPNGTARLILHVSALIPTAFAAFKNFEKELCLTEATVEDFMAACHPAAKSQLQRIVVRSVKDLPDYTSLSDKGMPSDTFDGALCELIESAILEEQNDENGEGIKMIVTSGRNLTLLTGGLMDYFGKPVFDQVKLIQFLAFGFAQSEFNQDVRKDKLDKSARKDQKQADVGIIRLDYHYPPAVGDAAHQDSFRFKVHFREVKELTFARAQDGVFNEDITTNFPKALAELEDLNVVGISGDCGFMMHYQCFARFLSQKTPIFMSSLILAGSLSLLCTKNERVLCLTANDTTFIPLKEKLLKHSGVEADLDQFFIGGCQDIPGFDAVAKGEKVDVPLVTKGMVPFVEELIARENKENPNNPIAFVLLECTELPPYADAIRQATGLPTYDVTSLIDFFHRCTSEKSWNASGYPPHNLPFWKKMMAAKDKPKEGGNIEMMTQEPPQDPLVAWLEAHGLGKYVKLIIQVTDAENVEDLKLLDDSMVEEVVKSVEMKLVSAQKFRLAMAELRGD